MDLVSRADDALRRREKREADARAVVDPAAAAGRAILSRQTSRTAGNLDVSGFARALEQRPPAPLRGGVPVNVRVPDILDAKLERWCAAHGGVPKRAVVHQLLVELLGEGR